MHEHIWMSTGCISKRFASFNPQAKFIWAFIWLIFVDHLPENKKPHTVRDVVKYHSRIHMEPSILPPNCSNEFLMKIEASLIAVDQIGLVCWSIQSAGGRLNEQPTLKEIRQLISNSSSSSFFFASCHCVALAGYWQRQKDMLFGIRFTVDNAVLRLNIILPWTITSLKALDPTIHSVQVQDVDKTIKTQNENYFVLFGKK